MDLGILDIKSSLPENDRLEVDLRLHRMAVEKLSADPLTAASLLALTIGREKPRLNGIECDFLAPSLTAAETDYVHLQTFLVCRPSREFQLAWTFPFLQSMPPAFQLMIQAHWADRSVIATASREQRTAVLGDSSRTFTGFIRMGMAHIGVSLGEWRDDEGHFKVAEGLDHIFFVLAIVLAGRGLWDLLKTVSGFTIGHSLTLGLTMFQIIHIHSRWVEIGIAASIAIVAARAFFHKGKKAENWIVATVFGAIHGLGFSTALRDLELPPQQVLPALIGFNVGVELGQAILILIFVGALWCARKYDRPIRQVLSAALALVGLYWTFTRFTG